VATIALGLGANAAIFSMVDGVLLKSAGYPEPERIVRVWEKHPQGSRNVISPANYLDWSRQSKSFEAIAANTAGSLSYTGSGEPRSLTVGFVSAPYSESSASRRRWPHLRGRRRSARRPEGGGAHPSPVDELFAGDRGAVGRTMLLNGEPYTVIGVLRGPATSTGGGTTSGSRW